MSRVAQRAAKIEAQLAELEKVLIVETRGGHGHPAQLTGVYGRDVHAARAVKRWYAEHVDSPLKPEHADLMKRSRLTLPRRAQVATHGTQGTSTTSGTHPTKETR
jgi:hypothetical protein